MYILLKTKQKIVKTTLIKGFELNMGIKTERRQEQILEILKSQNMADVSVLAETLDVSNTTIRNDLRRMEKDQLIYRLHGRIILRKTEQESQPATHISDGFSCSFSEKMMYVGEVARSLVSANDWIFLGCGYTCAAIAYALRNSSINVVTNNLYVASILSRNLASQVVLTGGYLSGPRHSFLSGDKFADSIRDITVSKAFIGAAGVDIEFGFSISNAIEKSIYSAIKPITQELIVVVDSSKFGEKDFMSIGKMNIADRIITDPGIPEKYEEYIIKNNIELITSIQS